MWRFPLEAARCLVFLESWLPGGLVTSGFEASSRGDPHQLKTELEPHHLDLWLRYAIAEAS